jgi:hypothetical protein
MSVSLHVSSFIETRPSGLMKSFLKDSEPRSKPNMELYSVFL